MKLSIIYETKIDPLQLLRRGNFTPDRLVDAPGSHSFLYTAPAGLLIDPTPGRSHSEWFDDDAAVADAYSDNDAGLSGRYTNDYYGLPVVAYWSWNSGMAPSRNFLREVSRALLPVMAKGAMAVLFPQDEVLPLAELAGIGGLRAGRGHQYWQMRQTSESCA